MVGRDCRISYVEVDAADLLWVANPVPKERQRDIDARREVVLRQIRVLKLLRESMHFKSLQT